VKFRLTRLTLLFAFFLCVGTVSAQTPDFSSVVIEDVTQASDSAQTAPDNSAQIQTLLEQYFRNVEAYRSAEDRYLISRQQYYQLNTLAAQEDAILKAKEVLQARAQVLRTYYTYLRLVLINTKGIELAAKEETLEQLELEAENMRFYQERVGSMTRRDEVATEFLVLNEQQQTLRALAFSSQALIKIGQLQVALDQAYATRSLVNEWLQQANITSASRAVKQRGMEEVDRQLQQADNNLDDVSLRWVNRTSESRFTESSYRQFQTEAEFTYLRLRQALSFLEEIVRGQ
jgi:hypothetical protein